MGNQKEKRKIIMYYLFRDDVLLQLSSSPEGIISEVNRALANFRTYGGLNFREDNNVFTAYYGNLKTNLTVRWEKEEDKKDFEDKVQTNF